MAIVLGQTNKTLVGYVDSSHANCKQIKSTEAYIFFLYGAPISWQSGRELIIAHSSTLAEFIAWDTAAKEVLWLQQLYTALGFNMTEPTVIHTNSANALTNLNKPAYTTGYKWVKIRF
jgi:hypothetical protein